VANRKFYVLRLPEDQVDSTGKDIEIQLVDNLGVTIAFGLIARMDTHLELDGEAVPTPVIEAARELPIGKGDFVDSAGSSVHPRDL